MGFGTNSDSESQVDGMDFHIVERDKIPLSGASNLTSKENFHN